MTIGKWDLERLQYTLANQSPEVQRLASATAGDGTQCMMTPRDGWEQCLDPHIVALLVWLLQSLPYWQLRTHVWTFRARWDGPWYRGLDEFRSWFADITWQQLLDVSRYRCYVTGQPWGETLQTTLSMTAPELHGELVLLSLSQVAEVPLWTCPECNTHRVFHSNTRTNKRNICLHCGEDALLSAYLRR